MPRETRIRLGAFGRKRFQIAYDTSVPSFGTATFEGAA